MKRKLYLLLALLAFGFSLNGCAEIGANIDRAIGIAPPLPMAVAVAEPAPAPMPMEDGIPVYEDYVQPPPIVYGEPMYLPPPIVVAYPYDYYVYERSGGFVNVVFFHGGIRHVEVWHNHGVRMTPAHYDTWRSKPENRFQRAVLERHRAQLETKHHITHPDAHYGVRPAVAKTGPGDNEHQSQPGHPARPGQQPAPQIGQSPVKQVESPAVMKGTNPQAKPGLTSGQSQRKEIQKPAKTPPQAPKAAPAALKQPAKPAPAQQKPAPAAKPALKKQEPKKEEKK